MFLRDAPRGLNRAGVPSMLVTGKKEAPPEGGALGVPFFVQT